MASNSETMMELLRMLPPKYVERLMADQTQARKRGMDQLGPSRDPRQRSVRQQPIMRR